MWGSSPQVQDQELYTPLREPVRHPNFWHCFFKKYFISKILQVKDFLICWLNLQTHPLNRAFLCVRRTSLGTAGKERGEPNCWHSVLQQLLKYQMISDFAWVVLTASVYQRDQPHSSSSIVLDNHPKWRVTIKKGTGDQIWLKGVEANTTSRSVLGPRKVLSVPWFLKLELNLESRKNTCKDPPHKPLH